jgi:hypothetical protein
MDSGIRPAGTRDTDVAPVELAQGVFEQALDGPAGRLPLPPDEIGAVIGEGDLEMSQLSTLNSQLSTRVSIPHFRLES